MPTTTTAHRCSRCFHGHVAADRCLDVAGTCTGWQSAARLERPPRRQLTVDSPIPRSVDPRVVNCGSPRRRRSDRHRCGGSEATTTITPLRFGELLRRYRLAAGLTQEGLAER